MRWMAWHPKSNPRISSRTFSRLESAKFLCDAQSVQRTLPVDHDWSFLGHSQLCGVMVDVWEIYGARPTTSCTPSWQAWKLFEIMDEDDNGEINADEFVPLEAPRWITHCLLKPSRKVWVGETARLVQLPALFLISRVRFPTGSFHTSPYCSLIIVILAATLLIGEANCQGKHVLTHTHTLLSPPKQDRSSFGVVYLFPQGGYSPSLIR